MKTNQSLQSENDEEYSLVENEINSKPASLELKEDFKFKLEQIFNKIKLLEDNFRNANLYIKEKCDFIRNDIEIEAERAHHFISKYKTEFLKKVDDYENECIVKFEKNEAYKSKIESFIVQMNEFYEKWYKNLHQSLINEKELKKATKKAESSIKAIESKLKMLDNQKFLGKTLKFKENEKKIDASIIGTLTKEKYNCKPRKADDYEGISQSFTCLTLILISIGKFSY